MSRNGSVLRQPLVTEKSARLKENNNTYVIEVGPAATKGQIRAEIQSRFKVQVLDVRTILLPGKYRRRVGPLGGYQPDRKKALVRVKQGQQIKWEEVA